MNSYHQDMEGYGYQEYYQAMQSLPTDNSIAPEVNEWALAAKMYSVDPASVSRIEYDPVQELLWTGSKDGRVQSYLAGIHFFEGQDMEPMRYSSFRASSVPIVDLWPLDTTIISLSRSSCRLHSKGGLLLSEIANSSIVSDTEIQFSCSSIFRKIPSTLSSYELANQQCWQNPSNLFVGTNSTQAFCFDLTKDTSVNTPKLVMNTMVATTRVVENGAFCIFGCVDGKLRLFDCRMRSDKAQHTLTAQTASVLDMSINIGGSTVATCGMEARAVNPYDPNSPTKIRSDPNVHLIDLRMMRTLSSVPPIAGSIPIGVRFGCRYSSCIPGKSNMVSSEELFILSNKGVISNVDTRMIGSPSAEILFALDEEDFSQNAVSTVFSISDTCALIAAATSIGTVSQFSRSINPELEEKTEINANSKPLEIPKLLPTPEFSFGTDYPSLGTSYVLSGAVLPQSLSSSFWSTPAVFKSKWKSGSRKKVSENILSGLVMHDFLGTAPNPGFKTNSLLYGSNAQSAYAPCDPRITSEEYDFVDDSPIPGGLDGIMDDSSIPKKFRFFKSPQGQERLNPPFNFSLYNSTGFVAFENSTINSYANPILLIFYFLKDVRSFGLNAQLSAYHQRNPNTLWCELGLLFHMMNLISQSDPTVSKIVLPNNFQIAFKQVPEALALNLMDNHSSGNADRYQLIQKFTKFMYSKLQQETESEENSKPKLQESEEVCFNLIRDLFCFTGVTTTTFLKSGTVESSAALELSTLELVYPVTTAPKAQGGGYVKKHSSFSSVVYASLQKESYMKGWCQQTKENEPFKKVRNIETLPQILTILAGETFDGPTTGSIILNGKKQTNFFEMYWVCENAIGGSWLPESIRILLGAEGKILVSEKLSSQEQSTSQDTVKWLVFDGETEIITETPLEASSNANLFEMSLFALASNIFPRNDPSKSHSILHVKLPSADCSSADLGSWFCFNDFVVTESSYTEVSRFPVDEFGGYRHPSVILFTTRSLVDVISLPPSLSSTGASTTSPILIPESVFGLESLSSVPCKHIARLPRGGEVVALDGEFVSVEAAKASVDSNGKRIASSDGRQFLARISIIDDMEVVLVDDYILPTEPVVDYVTRFSGIVAQDLNPSVSHHAVVHSRTALLKLRYFIDAGCILVGHGLQKDFETANIFVPPHQVQDTVELWRLPNKRKISLKFLASYLLDAGIQDEVHDSVEDAKTALALYKHYVKLKEQGEEILQDTLNKIYNFGNRTNWVIGFDKLSAGGAVDI